MRRSLWAVPASLLAFPASASAHGLGERGDLPIPDWLIGWGAAAVLIASFVALSALWTRVQLERRDLRGSLRLGPWLDVAGGAVGLLIFGTVVYAGLAGSQFPAENLAPTAIFVVLWVAVPIINAIFGDVFAWLNPWRAFARATGWLFRRITGRAPSHEPYPERLGRWPAVAGLAIFGWLELAYADRTDPSQLAVLGLGYASVQLIGMSLYGVNAWSRNGDAFGVYFGFIARLSPFARRDGRLTVNVPAASTTELRAIPGTAALLLVAIGTTSFDGFTGGSLWRDVFEPMREFFADSGFSISASEQWSNTVGLSMMIGLTSGFYWLGVNGMSTVGEDHGPRELGRRFGHSLIPIALAYAIAHYFSLLVFQMQALPNLIEDPLGRDDVVAGSQIDYSVLGSATLWYVQVGALVTGHVVGLILAHDRALVVYRNVRSATRSQYWMLAVMIGFTGLGLWLLSEASG